MRPKSNLIQFVIPYCDDWIQLRDRDCVNPGPKPRPPGTRMMRPESLVFGGCAFPPAIVPNKALSLSLWRQFLIKLSLSLSLSLSPRVSLSGSSSHRLLLLNVPNKALSQLSLRLSLSGSLDLRRGYEASLSPEPLASE